MRVRWPVVSLAAAVLAAAATVGGCGTADESFKPPDGETEMPGVMYCGGYITLAPGDQPPDCLPSTHPADQKSPGISRYEENYAFRSRAPLSPEAKAAGDAAARPIRAALERLRLSHVTTDTVRDALTQLGFPNAEIALRGATVPIEYGIRLPNQGACLHGTITSAGVQLTVEGQAAEGSCITPQSGH